MMTLRTFKKSDELFSSYVFYLSVFVLPTIAWPDVGSIFPSLHQLVSLSIYLSININLSGNSVCET